MKSITAAILLVLSFGASAQHGGHGNGGHGYDRHNHIRNHHYDSHLYHDNRRSYVGGWWAVPIVIGGVVVYQSSRPTTVIQQPVPQYTPQYQTCSEIVEIYNSDGTVTRTRFCQ